MSIEQPAKKRRSSLQLRKHEPLKTVQLNISRFRPPVNDKEYVTAAKGVIPVNTRSATNWALEVFKAWMKERNEVMASPDEIPKTSSTVVTRVSYPNSYDTSYWKFVKKTAVLILRHVLEVFCLV